MFEFLWLTASAFGLFFILFLIIPALKYTKIIMIILQLISSFALVSNIFYKKHSLYSAPRVQYIQTTDFFPIKSLYKIENDINFDKMDSNKFSIIQTGKYSNQCLENYFIKKDQSCPLTDIIYDNKSSNIYYDYIQKSSNEFFYYTNKNKFGKLYKSFNYSDFEKNNEDSLSNQEINKITKKEFNKISNPILDFKYFIKFFDVYCLIIISISLFISFYESDNDINFGVIRIYNSILQLIILIIYIIRYTKFIKVKQFLFDNEDIYKNDSYFPNKIINFDSVPLAISINIFIINTLYVAFPNHELCFKKPKNFLNIDYKVLTFIFCIFLTLSKIPIEVLDLINDSKIFPIYKNVMYNWKINPIKSIHLYNSTEHLASYINWKGYILELERLNDFNYINIYSTSITKLCGKDNLGNNLYFPENIDCPINDIFISKKVESIPGYTRLELDNNNYLYYTNQTTEGKLLIDFRISSDSEIPLNPEGDSESNYYSIPFYEEFDSDDKKFLYSINYLGVNSSSVSKNKIEKFEKKIDVYKKIYIAKIVLVCVEYSCLIIFIICFGHIYKKKKWMTFIIF